MAAADYRLMTEATGQRIAAALEALSGTGAAAAAARANLDVYSTDETDELIAQSTANKAKSAYLNWGKELTATGYHHGLLLVGRDAAYIVWFASTSDINIRSLRTGSVTKAASGTITFGNDNVDGTDYTITRNGSTITVTSTNNASISLIYN